ncbi:sialidase family protein [Nakamurella sp. A5-74]|uniref:exo-alpha-sialidase n=1 Tax=Nakamurella sp. A5-74 TaxID=3158264 RepID=A0AAU8DPH3_9ACTN
MLLRRLISAATAFVVVAAVPVALPLVAGAAPPAPLLDYSSSTTFNGTSEFVDHTADLNSVRSLTTGSVVARFKTSSTAAAKTILSASDVADPSSNITLSVNAGALHFEVRENVGAATTFATNLTAPGTYNDNQFHTVAVTVGTGGTRIYVDGYQVYAGTSTAFFSSVTGLDGLWVGKNADDTGNQWFYSGTIASVRVYSTALSAADVLTLSPSQTTLLSYAVNQSFNGSSTFLDKTSDLASVSGLSSGTIAAQFSTTSTAVTKTLLSASNTTNPSSNITLSVNNGNLYYEARSNGTYSAKVEVPGSYNDGAVHTVAIAMTSTGGHLYADGYRVGWVSTAGFFSSISGLNGMWIGRNVDSGGGQWYFNGTINWVRVYSSTLNDSEVKNISGASALNYQSVFDDGYASSKNYRIPALLRTQAGTILAAADQRVPSAADSPNDINTILRRSTDSGATWGSPQVLLNYPGTGAAGASTIDSAMVQDSGTGRIFLLVDHTPGGIGQVNAQAGTGYDANGYQVLTDTGGAAYSLRPNGTVYTSGGTLTGYTVDSAGNVTLAGAARGNIYLKNGADPNQSLLEARTFFLKLIYSDDDGVTWSNPVDLNTQVKESWMTFIGTSPGNGIELQHGAHAGRLVFPIYYTNGNGVLSSSTIYSDDNGATWDRGASPNDGRTYGGATIQSQTATASGASLHEAAIAEKSDGTIRMFMRNSSGTGKVAIATSANGGASWSQVTFDAALPDIFCQPAALSYPDLGDGKDRMLFANSTRSGRNDGVVRLSEDGGATWKYSRTLKANGYAYSSMITLPGGDIGVFWEEPYTGINFSRVPLSWLTASKS